MRGLSEIVVGWMHWSTEAKWTRGWEGFGGIRTEDDAHARSEHIGVRVSKGVR